MTKTEIDAEIVLSEYIVRLKDNWDDEGAKVINHTAYNMAVNDIYSMLQCDLNILSVYITPISDGSVDTQITLGTESSQKKLFLVTNFKEKQVDRHLEYIDY